jgi:hypothetical protein
MESSHTSLFVVLEGDVCCTENTIPLFAAFMANWFCNKEVKTTNYVALSWSDWHLGYAKKLYYATRVKNSRVGRFFELYKLPMNFHKNAYDFIGQGARAIAYGDTFCEKVRDTKVGNFWDLHLLSMLAQEAVHVDGNGWKNDNIALVATPVMFTHIPTMSDRFRGSGRLHTMAANESEAISRFICLDLSKEWGLANRLQTMVLWTMFCSMTNLGMYVLWEPKPACPCLFHEIFNFDLTGTPTRRIPFVRVLDDAKCNQWKCAVSDTAWCCGVIQSQTQPEDGYKYWQDTWKQIGEKLTEPLKSFLKTREPVINMVGKAIDEYWMKFNLADDIVDEAKTFAIENNFNCSDALHVGFHLRRTDFKICNLNEQLGKGNMTSRAEDDLVNRWQEADDYFQDGADFLCQIPSIHHLCRDFGEDTERFFFPSGINETLQYCNVYFFFSSPTPSPGTSCYMGILLRCRPKQ